MGMQKLIEIKNPKFQSLLAKFFDNLRALNHKPCLGENVEKSAKRVGLKLPTKYSKEDCIKEKIKETAEHKA